MVLTPRTMFSVLEINLIICTLGSMVLPVKSSHPSLPPEMSPLTKANHLSDYISEWKLCQITWRWCFSSNNACSRNLGGKHRMRDHNELNASVRTVNITPIRSNCSSYCFLKEDLIELQSEIRHCQKRMGDFTGTFVSITRQSSTDQSAYMCCSNSMGCIHYLELSNSKESVRITHRTNVGAVHRMDSVPNDGTAEERIAPNDPHLSFFKQEAPTRTERTRIKRAYLDPAKMQPTNLQAIPVNFGTLNITWSIDPDTEQWLTHYELIMINLNEAPPKEQQARCEAFLRSHSVPDKVLRPTTGTLVQDNQVKVNVSAPASFVVINGLPPDTFYRIILFAMAQAQRGPPASIPSSPRVPSLPPITAPEKVMVTTRGTQEAKVAWKPPHGADCTGELMNYVIMINSSRLLEPMRIRVAPEVRSYVVEDLIPGTYYIVQLAATTRGGVGKRSEPLRFRTGGELPRVELDEDEEEPFEAAFSSTESTMDVDVENNFYVGTGEGFGSNSAELGEDASSKYYMIPFKIQNLRARTYPTSIHLKWSVALRRINPALGHGLVMSNEEPFHTGDILQGIQQQNPMQIRVSSGEAGQDRIAYLPPGTKYIIRWGDMHPGPAEDTVTGDQTDYLIRDLRPGTMYYIRVIAVTLLGEGPAAYTMVMTDTAKKDETNRNAKKLIIPINLVVRAVGTNWARVSWELTKLPAANSKALHFQIEYNRILNGQAEDLGDVTIHRINVTLPRSSVVNNQFKATLRDLRPATQYEFKVCMPQATQDASVAGNLEQINDMCWSMVQGFETIGQGPLDPPGHIHITFPRIPTELHLPGSSKAPSPQSSTPRIQWTPPTKSNGVITSYAIYWTHDRQQTLSNWMEQVVAGSLRQYDLQFRLQQSQIYFLRMVARNRHGTSPFSPVVVFRTPDAQGQGGGQIRLSKIYQDPRYIEEPLDQLQGDQLLRENDTLQSVKPIVPGNEDHLRWIIVGSVLGGTTVCIVVAVVVMCKRCCLAKHPGGTIKWLPSKNAYIGAYNSARHHNINRPQSIMDVGAKSPSLNVPDACLGACSLNGSGTGGSMTGAHQVGLRTPQDASADSGIQCDCSVRHVKHCRSHAWPSVGRTQSHYHCGVGADGNRCVCQPEHNMPPAWIPGGVGGCWDDHQSTPGASEQDIGGSSTGGSRVMENGFNREHSGCFRSHHAPDGNTSAREMTTSFLAANVHQSQSLPFTADRPDLLQITHGGYFKQQPMARYPYNADMCDRSPDINLAQCRQYIMGGFVGSGSMNDDDMLTSSPASSSAGRASSGMRHLSTSPGHTKMNSRSGTNYPIVKLEQDSPLRAYGHGDQKSMRIHEVCKYNQPMISKSVFSPNGILKSTNLDFQPQTNLSCASSPANPRERNTTPTSSESRAAQMSFALDRVPTPEPTLRPTPFGRLAAEQLSQLAQEHLTAQKLNELVVGGELSALSPGLLKRQVSRMSSSGLEREYSAEELHQEMANLEGLMKDLNKITANEFAC